MEQLLCLAAITELHEDFVVVDEKQWCVLGSIHVLGLRKIYNSPQFGVHLK